MMFSYYSRCSREGLSWPLYGLISLTSLGAKVALSGVKGTAHDYEMSVRAIELPRVVAVSLNSTCWGPPMRALP